MSDNRNVWVFSTLDPYHAARWNTQVDGPTFENRKIRNGRGTSQWAATQIQWTYQCITLCTWERWIDIHFRICEQSMPSRIKKSNVMFSQVQTLGGLSLKSEAAAILAFRNNQCSRLSSPISHLPLWQKALNSTVFEDPPTPYSLELEESGSK